MRDIPYLMHRFTATFFPLVAGIISVIATVRYEAHPEEFIVSVLTAILFLAWAIRAEQKIALWEACQARAEHLKALMSYLQGDEHE